MRWWWLVVCALLMPALALGQARVAVHAVEARGELVAPLAEPVTAALAHGLGELDGVQASVVRPAPRLDGAAPLRSAGQVGRDVAAATGAEWVVLAVLLPTDDSPPAALASLCLYHRPGNLLQAFTPLRVPLGPDAAEALGRGLLAQATHGYRAAAYPTGDVTNSGVVEDHQRFLVRLSGSLPASSGGYLARLVTPSPNVQLTEEQFALPPEPLGVARLVQSVQGVSLFELQDEAPVEIGARLQFVPVGEAGTAPAPPSFVVTTRPWGAAVVLDGELVGASPLLLPRPDTETALQLTHPRTLPWRQPFRVQANNVVAVQLAEAGEPQPPVIAGPGVPLTVESNPSGADVLIDGVARGQTPLRLTGVNGHALVAVRRAGYKPWEVQLSATGPAMLRAGLELAAGGLLVRSQPTGAVVYLDGRAQGMTPLELANVATGPHELRLAMTGWPALSRPVVVKPGEVTRVDLTLGAEPSVRVAAASDAPLVERVLWERKDLVGGLKLHLVAAQTPGGTLVSVTLDPASAVTAETLAGGFALDFGDLPPWPARRWPLAVPGVQSLELGGFAGHARLRLRLAPGAAATAHPSSTAGRIRVIVAP